MSKNVENEVSSAAKLPMMLSHLTTCNLSQDYMSDDELFENSTFSVNQKINIGLDGIPLHCALFKTPPTNVYTNGKHVPGGYTPSGKWRNAHNTTSKMDKRAGH